MESIIKKWMFGILVLLLAVFVLGCSKNGGNGDQTDDPDKNMNTGDQGDKTSDVNINENRDADKPLSEKYDLPEDNQANHGRFKVLETEIGYYYNIGTINTVTNEKGLNIGVRDNIMNMFFYDKEYQFAIYLCDKPECRHQRTEDCVATYNGVWVLGQEIYDGYLYTYGEEHNDDVSRFALYRTALDGSFIDRVATVFEDENKTGSEYIVEPDIYIGESRDRFIIHKGYAYCPYYLKVGKGKDGFRGSGIIRIDIKSGRTEKIYEMNDENGAFVYWMIGNGDDIYFGMADNHLMINWYRYHDGKFEVSPWNSYEGLMVGIKNDVFYTELAEDKSKDGRKGNNRYDKKYIAYRIKSDGSAEKIDEKIIGETGINKITEKDLLIYGDYIVVIEKDRLVVYSSQADNFGEKIGELAFEEDTGTMASQKAEFKICSDVIYRVYTKPFPENPQEREKISHAEMGTYVVNGRFYQSCRLEDIVSGKGEWKEAFRTLNEEAP